MRDRNVKTYGRHKLRVIHCNSWLSDSDKKVFATSSENDSSLKQSSIFQSSSSGSDLGQLSLNSTGNSFADSHPHDRKKATRNTRKPRKVNENKENEVGKTKKQLNHRKDKSALLTSASDSSATETRPRVRGLRDRNKKLNYNDEVKSKETQDNRNCKRKRPDRVTAAPKTASINFSDFDNYSLIVSDSPTEAGKATNVSCVETSTPVRKRTRHHSNDRLKDADISVISLEQSPMSPTCGGTIPTPESCIRSAYSHLSSGSPYLEAANMSEKSSYATEDNDSYTASLRSSQVSNWSSRLRNRYTPQQANNMSASLFDSPTDCERSIQLLSDQLRKIVLKKQQTDLESLEEIGEEELDEEEETEDEIDEEDEIGEEEEDEEVDSDCSETEEEDESCEVEEEEVSDQVDETSEDECLSDIVEGESVDEEEEEDVDEETSEDEECQDTNRLNVHLSNQQRRSLENQTAVVNLQRLSESFVNNYVSARKTRNRHRKAETQRSVLSEESSDTSGSFQMSDRGSSGSNCTLYCLTEAAVTGNGWDSGHLFDSDSVSGRGSSIQSLDNSSLSSRLTEDEYHTAVEDESDETCDKQQLTASTTPCYTPKACSKRKKDLDELRHSFTEMLTPVRLKRKESLVPISFQTKVCLLCNQPGPISFKEALPNKMLSQSKKIGEGVYGEVFKSCSNGNSVAIKIIPIEGDFPVNDEPQKTYEEIISEIVIAKELSNLRSSHSSRTSNFCEVNNVSLVMGRYPAELLKQWDIFHKARRSENDRPDIFKDKQLYIVFEFADCGRDLESYEFDNFHQAKSVITQVAFALAVAEQELQFEHRDLHWGNVLIRETDHEDAVFKLCGKRISVPTMGVEANIIDFTLSRLNKDGCTVNVDLSKDDSLFQGKGDYQFDVYRNMKKENNNNWEEFHSKTNVFWLHYLADKLVYAIKYPSKSGRQDRELTRQFRQFISEMLNYASACEMTLDAHFLNS